MNKKYLPYYMGLIISSSASVYLYDTYGVKSMMAGIVIFIGCCITYIGKRSIK